MSSCRIKTRYRDMSSLSLMLCSSLRNKTKHSLNKPTHTRGTMARAKYFHFLQNPEMSPREVWGQHSKVFWVFPTVSRRTALLIPSFPCLVAYAQAGWSLNENTWGGAVLSSALYPGSWFLLSLKFGDFRLHPQGRYNCW